MRIVIGTAKMIDAVKSVLQIKSPMKPVGVGDGGATFPCPQHKWIGICCALCVKEGGKERENWFFHASG